jgi:hypothetical protein
MAKYVKHLSNDELLERMAEDLVQMHFETGIDLGYWETGFELVSRFYHTGVEVTIGDKKHNVRGGC